jgi:GT2 family glycosyltransferase
VAWADEIIVVDMFSSDDTAVICHAYPNCRVIQRDDYIFGNVNYGFDQATGDWVMRLDSDERITPELAAEVQATLVAPNTEVTGFEFWERPIILGRELRHGFGRKHYRKMMCRRGAARYPVRSEHEDLEASGVWIRSHHGYLHYNYANVAQYLEKMNYYTDRDVERARLPANKPSGLEPVRESARAFYLYFLKWRGFREGWVGFVDACMRAIYQFVYWAKLRERWEREHDVPDVREADLDVQISIVNTDNRHLLSACLASLPAACDGLRWKAAVVENASRDGSAEMLATQFPEIQVLRNHKCIGFSANHNQVIDPVLKAGSARYVLLLNEDTELDPGSVSELVAFCDARARVGAAGPIIRDPQGRRQPTFSAFPTIWRELLWAMWPGRTPRAPRRKGWLNGACLLLRMQSLKDVGLLDERFFIFFEDTDLARRLWNAGWQSGICQRSTILHHGHQTVARPTLSSDMECQMLRSRYLYFRKHHGPMVAAAVSLLLRGWLLLRAINAVLHSYLRREASERTNAALLFRLASYHPAMSLPHEMAAREWATGSSLLVSTFSSSESQQVAAHR